MTSSKQHHPATQISEDEAVALEIAPWDAIAPIRAADLDSGRDPSFNSVILPTVRTIFRQGRKPTSIIDIGCGVGRLTREFAKYSDGTVTALDPSPVSAQLASQYLASQHRFDVHNMTVQQYVRLGYGGHGLAVACMVLQDVVHLDSFLVATHSLLLPRGRLLIAITHPYYWPTYWHYDNEPWYRYDRVLFIRSEFRTSLARSGVQTLHVHRPLQTYFAALRSAGFLVEQLIEPMMPIAAQKRSGVEWNTPHFLFLVARRGR